MNQRVCDLIQRRRLQILVNSCIYYEFNGNVITDATWDKWAKELVDLQRDYPEESAAVIWNEAFLDWDGSTGAFLPLKDSWVQNKAHYIMRLCNTGSQSKIKKGVVKKRKLF